VTELGARFAAFDKANPHIGQMFDAITIGLIERRCKRYSADAILHQVRWETMFRVTHTWGSGVFKINDHWSACYARRFLDQYPQHEGFFELRTSEIDGDRQCVPAGQGELFA
jgi:hypothetical protein